MTRTGPNMSGFSPRLKRRARRAAAAGRGDHQGRAAGLGRDRPSTAHFQFSG